MASLRFEKIGQHYVIRHPYFSISSNLARELNSLDSQQAEVVIWDDYLVAKSKRGLAAKHISWPAYPNKLYEQVDLRGKLAIRADCLDSTSVIDHKDIYELFLKKRNPKNVFYLQNVVRFSGIPNLDAYSPLKNLQVSQYSGRISIVINFKDRPDMMERLLISLGKQKLKNEVEVLLVNNQSKIESVNSIREMVKVLPSSMTASILDYPHPFNHSKQCNFAVEKASGEMLVMMNNDACFADQTTLKTICDWASLPTVATAGPKITGDKGRLVSSGVHVYENKEMPYGVGIREGEEPAFANLIYENAGCTFACAAIRKEVWQQLGGLNETDFPTQYNDADFFLRALKQGLSHLYIGNVSTFHEPGKSEPRTVATSKEVLKKLCLAHPDMNEYLKLSILTTKPSLPEFDGVTGKLLRLGKRARKFLANPLEAIF